MGAVSNAKTTHRHKVYGLTVESWIPFPELLPAPSDAAVDAVFRLGEVPEKLPDCRQRGARYQAAPGKLLAWLDDVARYLVVDGREIVVEPANGVAESDLRYFLLTSPMGALLLQRGLLPLHASAIATPRGAVLFMGGSGMGKSTLAACFRQRGFRVLADDISVVSAGPDGRLMVSPGYPQLKLWPKAVDLLGADAAGMAQLRPNLQKLAAPLQSEFQSEALPLAQIYFLGVRNIPSTTLEVSKASESLRRLLLHTYRTQFVSGLGLVARHFQIVSKVAGQVRLVVATQPEFHRSVEALADVIALDMDGKAAP